MNYLHSLFVIALVCAVGCKESSADDFKSDSPIPGSQDPIKVEVQGHTGRLTLRFEGKPGVWFFVHPGLDNLLDTNDDLTLSNAGVFPSDVSFYAEYRTDDKRRGMLCAELELLVEVLPGQVETIELKNLEPGSASMNAHIYTGPQHYDAAGTIYIVPSNEVIAKILELQAANTAEMD